MKHATPLFTGFFAAAVLAGCAVSPPDRYQQVAELPASTDVSHARYSFSVTAPHYTLKNATWRVLLEHSEPRNTVLFGGMPVHSYTFSITLMGQNLDQVIFERFADVHRKNLRFVPSPYNEACLIGDRALYGRLRDMPARTYTAVCRDSASGEVYELALTERSILSEEDSSELFQAMRVFLSSFKFR